jgi:basic amino acid/polyamine antiporter, APA family
MLGVILSQVLGLSRMAFAMARRGDLPAALERVHPRFGVPHRAVLAVGDGGRDRRGDRDARRHRRGRVVHDPGLLRHRQRGRPPHARRAKLYPDVVPAVGLVACAVLAFSLSAATIVAGRAAGWRPQPPSSSRRSRAEPRASPGAAAR